MNPKNKIHRLNSDLPDSLDDATADEIVPWANKINNCEPLVSQFYDINPVTKGHKLFVPEYALPSLVSLAFSDALQAGLQAVEDGECDGFNIGFNWGKAAGQTISWPHIHLILRRDGDCKDPTGGVRRVVPGKGNYKKEKK